MAGGVIANQINTDFGVFQNNNAYSGIAKAWIYYNGSTQTVVNSFNVSSVTRNGTGDYTITFATAMPNANYATVGAVQNSTSNYGWCFTPNYNAAPTTSAVRVGTSNAGGSSLSDVAYCNVIVLGS